MQGGWCGRQVRNPVQPYMSAFRRGQPLLRILLRAGLAAALAVASGNAAQPGRGLQIVASRSLKIGGGTLQVDFAAGPLDLSQDAIFAHAQAAASAITASYGPFPSARAPGPI